MTIKSYFVNAVDAAIRQARQELGEDAMLIESRAASPEMRHVGRFEVVFGVVDSAQAASPRSHTGKELELGRSGSRSVVREPIETKREEVQPPQAPTVWPKLAPLVSPKQVPAALPKPAPPASPQQAPPPSGREDLAAELKMLRSQITELRKMLQPSPQPAPAAIEIEKIRNELIAADLDPVVAANLIDAAETIWESPLVGAPGSGARTENLRQIVGECVRRNIQTAHDLNCAASRGNVTTFVGPPGAGKTTVLAKIAVQHCLAKRRSVRVISVDTERTGGHELLRAYCSVLGIGFAAAKSLSDLQDALSDGAEKMCLLIDTPGFAPNEMAAARDLATVLDRIAGHEVHLVLPASMKRTDAAAYADHFTLFNPGRLLFTKLDEASSLGSILSEALRLRIPLSFFSTGQDIPEDLKNADPEMLIGRLFPANAAPAASAA